MHPEDGRKLAATLLAAGVVTWAMAQPGFGFTAWLLALVLMFAIPHRIIQAVRVPATRPLQVARIGIWLAALALVTTVHYERSEASRRAADEVLAKITAFSARHGRCAANLREVGLTQKELSEKIGTWSYYVCEHGRRHFFYRATFLYFAIYRYDFAARSWQYLPQ